MSNHLNTPILHFRAYDQGVFWGSQAGLSILECELPECWLNVGPHRLNLYLTDPPGGEMHDLLEAVCSFQVEVHHAAAWLGWRQESFVISKMTCGPKFINPKMRSVRHTDPMQGTLISEKQMNQECNFCGSAQLRLVKTTSRARLLGEYEKTFGLSFPSPILDSNFAFDSIRRFECMECGTVTFRPQILGDGAYYNFLSKNLHGITQKADGNIR